MAQSQNSSVDLTIRATSFAGLGTYGNVLVGNAAFEFYNERNPEDYIQIPWDEVDYISAEVIGKRITRFAIFAISALCVIMTTVVPWFFTISSITSRTS